MVKRGWKSSPIILGLVLLMMISVRAELVINEVMSNEPGSSTTLEWIELYNNSTVSISLGFHTLIIDGVPMSLPDNGVRAQEYLILCRKLYADAGSPGFESVWGDSTGIWGDNTELEFYDVVEVDSIRLTNTGGEIKLNRLLTQVSRFVWQESGSDGVSWERYLPTDTVVYSCLDPKGSTPGEENSVTPKDNDLALVEVNVYPAEEGQCGFEAMLVNVGLLSQPAGNLRVSYDPERDSVADSTDLIAIFDFPATEPGDTLIADTYLDLDGYSPELLIELPEDDKMLNNKKIITGFGRLYPPIILSEFIADPQGSLEVEWVELKNRSDFDLDLHYWYLGDEIKLQPIVGSEYILPAGDYVVLTKDTSLLMSYYDDIPRYLQMSSWAALNNDTDFIRLRDNYEFVIDSFWYVHTFGGNYSWGRSEDPGMRNSWGRSVDSGGTPGYANEIYLQASSSSIEVTVSPNPFSPTEDEMMLIDFSVPAGDNLTAKIYDTEGRVVKTLVDGVPAYDGRIEWNGYSDGGRRLPIGIYILYFEVSEAGQYKQTVVIAP
nr:lamin tail domain-containing protein [candidate division Zixibacteria bacterium]